MQRTIQKRDLLVTMLLVIFTFGIYYLYWLYQTKEDINSLGGAIPTFWFAILPFLNIYFMYCYAADFVRCVRHQNDQGQVIAYFLLMLFFGFLSPLVVQPELNKFASFQS